MDGFRTAIETYCIGPDVKHVRFVPYDPGDGFERLEIEVTYTDDTVGRVAQSDSHPYEWDLLTPFVPSLTE